MTAESSEDIEGLKEIGKIVAVTIREMKRHARSGMTTKELDEYGGQLLASFGAVSAPKVTYQFPGYTCISVNREVAHGIPGERVLKPGDLVNIDVSAMKGGYYADSGHSYVLESSNPALKRLCDHTHYTMMKVIRSLRPGMKLNEIGRIIQAEARRGGYMVIQNLCSHGIGKALHEPPEEILPVYDKSEKRVLKEGQVITIEPFLSTGAEYVVGMPDGWTLKTPDRSYAAQHEHTVIVTKERPIIVTVA
ncbi:type I methionyl aminopeptidase [Gorillibacterium sp. sgz5001074]|uniref:type I methionyl aminopeptidase n=1 Tax=Gorillibacterium sp. sgz5001074 TaxID=3446695 RepID=UPI003F672B02